MCAAPYDDLAANEVGDDEDGDRGQILCKLAGVRLQHLSHEAFSL